MPSTALSPTPFVYVQTDVPHGQTLLAWRRDRDEARRSARPRRRFRFPQLRTPRLRVAT
ncbi:MAG TPA: hypothetical protein VGW10_01395 [Solirubrobacteraceae bacterium]|nr:hypothetical protein [Solirubrobacteraceae bacterium]